MEEKEILNAQNEEEIGDDEVVQLVTEDGETLDFFFVASIEYKGEWFAFFQPAEPMADIEDDEIVIFKIAEENGEDIFEPIEDEKLLDEVYDEYVKLHSEYFDEKEGIDVRCECGCEHHGQDDCEHHGHEGCGHKEGECCHDRHESGECECGKEEGGEGKGCCHSEEGEGKCKRRGEKGKEKCRNKKKKEASGNK